jgi:hypothetical protein
MCQGQIGFTNISYSVFPEPSLNSYIWFRVTTLIVYKKTISLNFILYKNKLFFYIWKKKNFVHMKYEVLTNLKWKWCASQMSSGTTLPLKKLNVGSIFNIKSAYNKYIYIYQTLTTEKKIARDNYYLFLFYIAMQNKKNEVYFPLLIMWILGSTSQLFKNNKLERCIFLILNITIITIKNIFVVVLFNFR